MARGKGRQRTPNSGIGEKRSQPSEEQATKKKRRKK